jgi:hypothetical protein
LKICGNQLLIYDPNSVGQENARFLHEAEARHQRRGPEQTEYITFDVVDMHYPYSAISGRGLLNTFEDALHLAYLCLVISDYGSQRDVRNIEQGFALGHKNIHFLREAPENYQQDLHLVDTKATTEAKTAIETDCETKRVALDPIVPNKIVLIGKDLSPEEEMELLSFLDKNNDVFTWSTSDLVGVSRGIAEHKLNVNSSVKLKKQKHHKMSDKKIAAAKTEVQRLLDACFMREVNFSRKKM